MRAVLALVMLVLLSVPALAVRPDEMLADPGLEAREGLSCLVCQNQSIDDSDADLAHDLRVLVRERLTAGDSDQAVLDYIVARYGEYVLLNPVVAPHTILLWVAAPVVLVIGGIVVFVGSRRKRVAGQAALTEDEAKALEELER
jgi:cytochrome c-type biogenesis protein CcmH